MPLSTYDMMDAYIRQEKARRCEDQTEIKCSKSQKKMIEGYMGKNQQQGMW